MKISLIHNQPPSNISAPLISSQDSPTRSPASLTYLILTICTYIILSTNLHLKHLKGIFQLTPMSDRLQYYRLLTHVLIITYLVKPSTSLLSSSTPYCKIPNNIQPIIRSALLTPGERKIHAQTCHALAVHLFKHAADYLKALLNGASFFYS